MFELNKVLSLEILIFYHFPLGIPQIKVLVFWTDIWYHFDNFDVDHAYDEVLIKKIWLELLFIMIYHEQMKLKEKNG